MRFCGQWTQPINDRWGPLSKLTWTAAGSMTVDPTPLIADRSHCVQALITVMWRKGRWACPRADRDVSTLPQSQLGASSVGVAKMKSTCSSSLVANLLSDVLTSQARCCPCRKNCGHGSRMAPRSFMEVFTCHFHLFFDTWYGPGRGGATADMTLHDRLIRMTGNGR